MFENIDAYSKLLKIAQRNPKNLKRLIVVAPDQSLTFNNVEDILKQSPNIKHYHVRDDVTAWANWRIVNDLVNAEQILKDNAVSANPVISLDFGKCTGNSTIKRIFLLSLLDKIRKGTTLLIWNYYVQSLPCGLVDVFNKVLEPTSYTYKESNKPSENMGSSPVIINKAFSLNTRHETFEELLKDNSLNKKAIIHTDCNVYLDSVYEELVAGCKLNYIGTKHELDIWKVLDSKVETYLTIVKDGVDATAIKLIELFVTQQKNIKDISRIIILSNNSTLVKPLSAGLGRMATSIKLIRSNLFSKLIETTATERAKQRFIKKPAGQFNEPMEIIDLNRCIQFDTIYKTLNWFKQNGGINIKVICLGDEAYYNQIDYREHSKVITYNDSVGYYVHNTLLTLNPLEAFISSIQDFLDSNDWKSNRTGYTFFFFCKLNLFNYRDEVIDHLKNMEYLIKSFEVVNATDPKEIQNSFFKVEPIEAEPSEINIADLFNTGWLDNTCEEPQVNSDGLNKDYAELFNIDEPSHEFVDIDPLSVPKDTNNNTPKSVNVVEWIKQKINGGMFNQLDGFYKLNPVVGGLTDYKTDDIMALKISYFENANTRTTNQIPTFYMNDGQRFQNSYAKEVCFLTTVKVIGHIGADVLAVNDTVIIPTPVNLNGKCWVLFPSTFLPHRLPEPAGVDFMNRPVDAYGRVMADQSSMFYTQPTMSDMYPFTLVLEINKSAFNGVDFDLSKVCFSFG